MLKPSARSVIRLRGVRQNNLKDFDLDLPLNQLIVITGLSGSGKSSLAFDTLFAEGQRRYIETFSPYARQFFDRMDKPQVDSIEGIPPAIAIEQRNAVRTTRSTVGTMTEICDYMKMLWPHIAQLHCRRCAQPVRKDSPQSIWTTLLTHPPTPNPQPVSTITNHESAGTDLLITFDLPLTQKLSLDESLALISKQGYQRLLLEGQIVRLGELSSGIAQHASRPGALTVIQDRLTPTEGHRARFMEACEQAYHFGKGKLAIREVHPPSSILRPRLFSNRLHCAECDIEYREPSPALFSFNHPVGACPTCRGFGRIISINYHHAIPDTTKTLAQGVVKPWQSGQGAECQSDLLRVCKHFGIPTDVPFERLPKKWRDFVIEGEPDYGKDEEHEWPRAWYGVKGYFRWLESKAYKMHVRVLLSRYRAYTSCPDCQGKRFQPDTLLYRVLRPGPGARSQQSEGKNQTPPAGSDNAPTDISHDGSLSLADFYQLPIRDSLGFIDRLAERHPLQPNTPLGLVLNEVRSRLGYLDQVGLGYLTLDRPTRTLSGGETERVNLTTCLGTRLVNTLFVLDEPSLGLHPRDTERLVQILERLRDAGNTVVVVEHERSVMRAADQIVDLGPGSGASGGQVVFQGSFEEILRSEASLTGQYLSGGKQIEIPHRRTVNAAPATRLSRYFQSGGDRSDACVLNDAPMASAHRRPACPGLRLTHATRHNLKDLNVEIPLGRFVCITGVSGSGKTTLVREVLLPALAANLRSDRADVKASDRLEPEDDARMEGHDRVFGVPQGADLAGWEQLGQVVLVDQSILGKTPRSNSAVYIGAFDDIREFFAQSDSAKQRGLNASAFSFNSRLGQCERCRGAGFEKIEMQFLSDVFIRCPDCNGRRYRSHILEVKVSANSEGRGKGSGVRRSERAAGRGSRNTRETTRLTRPVSNSFSIADLLDATVAEAVEFLSAFPESRPAQRAVESLKLLLEVGLAYLRLGQPINTLSGGESQRLKLVRHLAEVGAARQSQDPFSFSEGVGERVGETAPYHSSSRSPDGPSSLGGSDRKPILFLFDEPTTGLHFDDVRMLLMVFQRLVEAGHSVLVIEHNLEVIKCADWVIDLGPDAGDQGGLVIAEGTPEQIASHPQSHTGRALGEVLDWQAALSQT